MADRSPVGEEWIATWDALEEAQRSHILATVRRAAALHARYHRDKHATPATAEELPVEILDVWHEDAALVVVYMFEVWEDCPSWRNHVVFGGTSTFESGAARNIIEVRRRTRLEPSAEADFDRATLLAEIREAIARRYDRGIAIWDALDTDRRKHVLATLSKLAGRRARADRDLYASNSTEDVTHVEILDCARTGGALVVAYLFEWWEWCPAISGSDWNYHYIYTGTARFEDGKLVTDDIVPRKTRISEYDEDTYDRGRAVQAVRDEIAKRPHP